MPVEELRKGVPSDHDAQYPDGGQLGPVWVWMYDKEGRRESVDVYPDGVWRGEARATRCRLPCAMQLPRGRYILHIAQTAETLEGKRVISIDAPSRLTITPKNTGNRVLGLPLGIGGVALLGAGIGLAIDGDARRPVAASCSEHTVCYAPWNAEEVAGLVAIFTGLAATPVG